MDPDDKDRPREPQTRRGRGELAALTTALLLVACWIMLVL